jgi:hypothetical protein
MNHRAKDIELITDRLQSRCCSGLDCNRESSQKNGSAVRRLTQLGC